MILNESIVEDATLGWFGELGYSVKHGPHIAPGEPAAERDSFGEVVLVGRLREAITTEGQVIDVFTAAGLPKPDISILRSARNLVQRQVFSEKLKETLDGYHNRAISTLQVIEELIKLGKRP
jgi:hypothetical protein